jgi:hypothetical protein
MSTDQRIFGSRPRGLEPWTAWAGDSADFFRELARGEVGGGVAPASGQWELQGSRAGPGQLDSLSLEQTLEIR